MKFSEAMSWSVVFWRSTSASMRSNSSVSRSVGQGMGALLGSAVGFGGQWSAGRSGAGGQAGVGDDADLLPE